MRIFFLLFVFTSLLIHRNTIKINLLRIIIECLLHDRYLNLGRIFENHIHEVLPINIIDLHRYLLCLPPYQAIIHEEDIILESRSDEWIFILHGMCHPLEMKYTMKETTIGNIIEVMNQNHYLVGTLEIGMIGIYIWKGLNGRIVKGIECWQSIEEKRFGANDIRKLLILHEDILV